MNTSIEPRRSVLTLIVSVLWLVTGTGNWGAAGTAVVVWGDGPTNVPVGLTNVVGIASGNSHNLVLKSDGTVVAWGDNYWGQTNVPAGLDNVVSVAAGRANSLALKSDGTVVAWGHDFVLPTVVPLGLSNVVAVAGGWSHSLALKNDGTVVVLSNDDIDDGDLGATNVPAGLSNIVALATGGAHHCLVLKDDSTVVGWGDNNAGSVTGVPSDPPYYAAGQVILDGHLLSNIVAVAAGNHPSLALKTDGTVIGWPDDMPVPDGLSNVVAIAANVAIDLALRSDGTVARWGYSSQPLPPVGLTNVVAVAAGGDHSIALVTDHFSSDGSPQIIQPPFSHTANTGSSALFRVDAVGMLPLGFQWQFNGSNIDGAIHPALLLTNIPVTSAGSYRCVVTNAFGTNVSSAGVLTVLPSTLRFDSSSTALQFTNGGFSLRLTGLSGHGDVVVYVSTNLMNWDPIITNPPIVGDLQFIDSTTSNLPSRFYRAEER